MPLRIFFSPTKRIGLLCFAIILLLPEKSDAQLSPDSCCTLARRHYPLSMQADNISESTRLGLAAAGTAYLPQLSLTGRATRQSDVTKLNLPASLVSVLPASIDLSFPHPRKDQYDVRIEAAQALWDGGYTAAKREALRREADVQTGQMNVSLYGLDKQVYDLFFGILRLKATLKSAEVYLAMLDRAAENVQLSVGAGLAEKDDSDNVRLRQLDLDKETETLKGNLEASRRMLSLLIGRDISVSELVLPPEPNAALNMPVNRPELLLYHSQIAQIKSEKKGIDAAIMPRFSAFAVAGYGNPGLNMLEDKFSPYYLLGVQLQWQFGALYHRSADLKRLRTIVAGVEIQEEVFRANLSLAVAAAEEAIVSLRKRMASDEETIRLRQSMSRRAELKFSQGTGSATALLDALADEHRAQLEAETDRIDLIARCYGLKYLLNTPISCTQPTLSAAKP